MNHDAFRYGENLPKDINSVVFSRLMSLTESFYDPNSQTHYSLLYDDAAFFDTDVIS
jgi:hypothetical protein